MPRSLLEPVTDQGCTNFSVNIVYQVTMDGMFGRNTAHLPSISSSGSWAHPVDEWLDPAFLADLNTLPPGALPPFAFPNASDAGAYCGGQYNDLMWVLCTSPAHCPGTLGYTCDGGSHVHRLVWSYELPVAAFEPLAQRLYLECKAEFECNGSCWNAWAGPEEGAGEGYNYTYTYNSSTPGLEGCCKAPSAADPSMRLYFQDGLALFEPNFGRADVLPSAGNEEYADAYLGGKDLAAEREKCNTHDDMFWYSCVSLDGSCNGTDSFAYCAPAEYCSTRHQYCRVMAAWTDCCNCCWETVDQEENTWYLMTEIQLGGRVLRSEHCDPPKSTRVGRRPRG